MITCMAKKPFIYIISVAKTLYLISFLVIEIIVYLYIQYLLSRRAKGRRSQSFAGNVDKGKAPKSVWYVGLMLIHVGVSKKKTCFGASYT